MKKTERKTKTTTDERGPSSSAVPSSADSGESMTLEEIKELIELIADKQFTEFELERGDVRIRLQRGGAKGIEEIISQAANHTLAIPAVTPEVRPSAAQPSGAAVALAPAEEPLHLVTSPIVGTFYRAPSPDAEPFVAVGDLVKVDTTLCIIEAMKLMNEIHSDVNGAVAKILVENGQPVEYGQPLFGIKV